MSINGTPVGSYSHLGKTFTLVDESGAEYTGVIVDQATVFTATADDIKIGKVAATEEGVTEGADTRTYRTIQGYRLIPSGDNLSILLSDNDQYDYTELQCMIAPFNTSITNSVAVNQVVLKDSVYNVGSTTKISDVIKNSANKSIDLNITNNTDDYVVVYYFTYK